MIKTKEDCNLREAKAKARDPYWDIVKGIAILLVLIGHSIQYGSGVEYSTSLLYLDNPIYKVIYGFHMPLFMFVSGYFFVRSAERRSFLQTLMHVSKTLFLPILAFRFLYCLISGFDLTVSGVVGSLFGTLWTLWFLWAVIFAMVVTSFVHRYMSDSYWAHIVVLLVLLILPDPIQTAQVKFVYPFFVLGYYFRKTKMYDTLIQHKEKMALPAFLLYVLLIIFVMNRDTYVYFTKVSLFHSTDILHQLYCDSARIVIGLTGIFAFITMTRIIFERLSNASISRTLAFFGINSMGIYCFQDLLISITSKITPPHWARNR